MSVRCPPRQWCPGCQEEMNHRDHRKLFESSSGFGQIMWRDFGRGRFGFADLDLVLQTDWGQSGLPLAMLFEHKETDAKLGPSQRAILRTLAIAVHAAVVGHLFDRHSGVYVVRGHIAGRTSGRRETYMDGPQVIERMLPRLRDEATESWTVNGQDDFFRWIDERLGYTPEGRRWRDGAQP